MGTLEKRGKRWRAAVWVKGVRKKKSFDTKAEATHWIADTERSIRIGRGIEVAGRTLGDALNRFSREECPHRNRTHWEQTRLAFLAVDPIAQTPLADLTPEAVLDWQRRQLERVSGETVRRDRALLSAVMTQAVNIWRWLPVSPFKAVRLPEAGEHRKRNATPEEIAKLWQATGTSLETLQSRVVAAFEFACETGMRGGEIIAMRPSDVSGAVVHIPKTKNGDARDVALSPRAVEIVTAMLRRGADPVWDVSSSQKDALFRKVARRAAISGLTFHDSRHTACLNLSRKLTVLELAKQLGHRDLNSLLVYYQDSAEERAKRL